MSIRMLEHGEILDDHVRAYQIFRMRIQDFGPNAPFPEFGSVVESQLAHLDAPEIQAVLDAHPDLRLEEEDVRLACAHINLRFEYGDEVSYTGARLFPEPFPYRPTIDAIENNLRLIRKLEQFRPGSTPGKNTFAVNYAYYRHDLLADPDVVLIPTIAPLSREDLIRMSGAPIGFIGVTDHTLHVDGEKQNVDDFWFHDINHFRMLISRLRSCERKLGVSTDDQKIALYEQHRDVVINDILPALVELPDMSDSDIAIRRLASILFFELLHERSIMPNSDDLIDAICNSRITQPFEKVIDLEKGTTSNGGLILRSRELKTVRHVEAPALPTLASVKSRLRYFYDERNNHTDEVAPDAYRTPEYIAEAAVYALKTLGCTKIPTRNQLFQLIHPVEDLSTAVQRATALKSVKQLPYVAEPMSVDDVVSKVSSLGKNVHTLFGFSYFGYENPQIVMSQIREELSQLDPSTTIINIGATKEGIGQAYKVAKELGFTTIGVVSTAALSYSFQFSRFVDHIFIVDDAHWGGALDDQGNLTGATQAFLRVSDSISVYGGAHNTVVAITEALKRGIPVQFHEAEMNHEIANRDHIRLGVNIAHGSYLGPMHDAWQRMNVGVGRELKPLQPGSEDGS